MEEKMRQNRHISFFLYIIVCTLTICSCTSDKGYERYIIKDVTLPCDIVLYASDTTNIPSSISMFITGIISGDCVFEIENGCGRYKTIRLKDTIDCFYRNEWYDHKINIKYIPDTKIIGDSILIKYQIW